MITEHRMKIGWSSAGKPGCWICFVLGMLWLMNSGCASKNVNPSSPKTQTGYVDLIGDDPDHWWQVDEVKAGSTNRVFVRYKPLEEHVLRLAFPPGTHKLSVRILNHTILEPGTIDVDVQDGKITPVHLTLIESGKTLTENRQVRVGGTVYGRYGRGTRIRAGEAVLYQVDLKSETQLTYQSKKDMPYANPPHP
jgi:hypothetical protein